MLFKSWPVTHESRRKKCQGWRSCPIIYRTLSKQWVSSPHRRKTTSLVERANSGSSPTPGPSVILSWKSAKRVQSCKRKDMCEEMQQEPSKKSRSGSNATPGPSHTSGRGKWKSKGKKETALAKKLWKKKIYPECPTDSRSARVSSESHKEEESQERGSEVSRSSSCSSRSRQGPAPAEESSSSKTLREEKRSRFSSRDYENTVKEFNKKYLQVDYIQEGGYGQVFSGVRIVDNFPVAIKHIKWANVRFTDVELNGTNTRIPLEVYLLMKVGAGPGTDSCSVTPVLLDWYDLGTEIVLVLERPEPCADMVVYLSERGLKGLSETETKVIFQQLVDAAIVMESKGVFHRDIKPHNILIESGHDIPRARFIDFGSARAFTPGQEFDGPQGTPIFSSPEWFRSEPYLAGPTTVWQMGIVLYELLFNKLPLISEHSIGSKRGVPIPSSLSIPLRDLMRGCLEKNPSKRYSLQDVRNHPWLN